MKLAELAGYNANPLIVTERYEAFVREERPFTQGALAFADKQLSSTPRKRKGTFSASSLGSCLRQQQFTWLGMPEQPQSGQRVGVLMNGDFVHLRLQMIGLSEGFLKQAEVRVGKNEYGLAGTLDGVTDTDDVFEAKSINQRAYEMVKHNNEAKDEHRWQVSTYMMTANKNRAVIFYENKNTQHVKEYVIERDQDIELDVLRRVTTLLNETHDEKLFPMLDDCVEKKGWQHDYCSFKDVCPKMKSWRQAKDTAEAV